MATPASLTPGSVTFEARAARWVPWIAFTVAVAAVGVWWALAYSPYQPTVVVVEERRGCDICICANPCPCDCECECSVASPHDHQHAIGAATGPVRRPPRPLNLALGVGALLLPIGLFAFWRRRHAVPEDPRSV